MTVSSGEKMWRKCRKCEQIIYEKELSENFWACPKCKTYFRINAAERLSMLVDEKSFREIAAGISSRDVLKFPGYAEKISSCPAGDAVSVGRAKIGNHDVVVAAMAFEVMGGSMGSVVGEKITLAAETAAERRLPLIVVSASGGARMQEGIFSLMQMAKTSAALARLHKSRVPFISVLTDPTTGGVSASYAMLGDVNIAESDSLIGFAGPRVIEETIKQKLPEGFQRAEFLEEHGMIDVVVERKNLKSVIAGVLNVLSPRPAVAPRRS